MLSRSLTASYSTLKIRFPFQVYNYHLQYVFHCWHSNKYNPLVFEPGLRVPEYYAGNPTSLANSGE